MRCRVCLAATTRVRVTGTWFDRCTVCGYAFLRHPGPSHDYWPEDGAGASAFWSRAKTAYFGSALELLAGMVVGRRLLDVGGGAGFFSEQALRSGWDAFSLDVSPVATRASSDRLGVDRALTSIGALEPASFDVATLWCVIAHVDDSVALMSDVSRVLKPGGLAWITTPNFQFQAPFGALRRWARRPIDFAGDDHRGQFTPRAATAMLARSGFGAPSWQHRGITEYCGASMSEKRLEIGLKRAWNRAAFAATTHGLPNMMSELQMLAVVPGG